eukprot:7927007-Alexandrium_andersonii.AAC.1
MSASLVGSEMCIRDSLPCVRLGVPVRLRVRARMACARTCISVSLQLPVSYTHLTLPTICSV